MQRKVNFHQSSKLALCLLLRKFKILCIITLIKKNRIMFNFKSTIAEEGKGDISL